MNGNRFYKNKKIRQQTLQLVSQLSRWCQVREDLMYAFERCLSTGLEDPMRQAVRAFLTRVRGGMSIEEALERFEHSFSEEHFRDLMVALKFNFHYRGDLPRLLEHMEAQLYRIEEELTHRKISSVRDRRLCWLIVLMGPLILLFRMMTDGMTRELFFHHPLGPVLLAISLCGTGLAVGGLWLIQQRMTR